MSEFNPGDRVEYVGNNEGKYVSRELIGQRGTVRNFDGGSVTVKWDSGYRDTIHVLPDNIRRVDRPTTSDVFHTSSTGGRKQVKAEAYALLPWDFIDEIARHYGAGAEKYEDRNWERGYPTSLAMSSLMRHLKAYWQDREDNDPEMGTSHLAAAAFHLGVMFRFQGTEFDDRPNGESSDTDN